MIVPRLVVPSRVAKLGSKPFSPARRRRYTRHAGETVSLGIRREDPGRIWERRSPLTPSAVASLIADEGVRVVVQACQRRVFSDAEFEAAGAIVQDRLTDQSIIIGIKEIPLAELDTTPIGGYARTHIMFSHTAKGQSYNLPLLARFLGNPLSPRLIDYEQLTSDKDGKRTVAFGFFAGSAGVVEGLHASALDLLQIGIASPFLHLPRPFTHRDLASVKASLRLVGDYIAAHGMAPAAGPFVIALSGSGNVARGALDMLAELPTQFIAPEQLPSLFSDPDVDLKRVYIVHAHPESYIIRRDGMKYTRSAYYANPADFQSRFHETIAPYISLLINGAGWQPGFPRLMSNEQLVHAIRKADAIGKARFRSVADVSCDVEGGLEFASRATTIDAPFYTARPKSLPANTRGIQVMAVDILPTEIPLDASTHFSNALMPYLRALVRQEQRRRQELNAITHSGNGWNGVPVEDATFLEALDRATIAKYGKLMPQHEWLYNSLATLKGQSSSAAPTINRRKKVLLFGSGMVAKPFCETIWSRSKDVELIVASNNVAEARALVSGHEGESTVISVDITNDAAVGTLIAGVDVIASLLPATLHVQIAKHCLQHRKHLVTASYISPAMKDLRQSALDADVLFLNEIGLDPGIDHMSAMKMRDRLQHEGKRIVSFISWCGGLPAPEDSNVPLGIKFSWSPKALLSAAFNDARFKMNGQMDYIPGSDLLSKHFPSVPITPGLALEGLANRDSIPYAETYKLGPLESLATVFRGTLRYRGFSTLLQTMASCGMLSTRETDRIRLKHWNELGGTAMRVAQSSNVFSTAFEDSMIALSIFPGGPTDDLPSLPQCPQTPLDLVCTLLAHKLRYRPGERDMVILNHEIVTQPDVVSASVAGAPMQQEVHSSILVAYGEVGGNSAMSRTVGLPLAAAILRILDGKVHARGVMAPVESEIYLPVLDDLGEQGIVLKETVSSGKGMASALLHAHN